MELPHIGNLCNVELCQQLDFLPIKCNICGKSFCKHHYLADKHDCRETSINPIKKKENEEHVKYECRLPYCNDWELTPVCCSFCLQTFCLKHRHQIDHACSKYIPPTNPMAEAAAKVNELTKNLKSEPKRSKKIKNEKLAAQVQLMKLKGKAVGNTEVPLNERVYFLVSFPKNLSSKENPLALFISHNWTVGKALDSIAEVTKVTNRNNESKAPRLQLFRFSDGVALKPLDAPLKELLDKMIIYNGQSIILEYSSKETDVLDSLELYNS